MSLYLTEAEVADLGSPAAAFAAVEGSLRRQPAARSRTRRAFA
jgi:hypothetical protein